mmetsp:Transcript_38576/g.115790  ORF Transcript_38576/g.115790 Transcript_38576/m.115790 type:complete len:333 (-) Transcript_38576:3518-4516(-)
MTSCPSCLCLMEPLLFVKISTLVFSSFKSICSSTHLFVIFLRSRRNSSSAEESTRLPGDGKAMSVSLVSTICSGLPMLASAALDSESPLGIDPFGKSSSSSFKWSVSIKPMSNISESKSTSPERSGTSFKQDVTSSIANVLPSLTSFRKLQHNFLRCCRKAIACLNRYSDSPRLCSSSAIRSVSNFISFLDEDSSSIFFLLSATKSSFCLRNTIISELMSERRLRALSRDITTALNSSDGIRSKSFVDNAFHFKPQPFRVSISPRQNASLQGLLITFSRSDIALIVPQTSAERTFEALIMVLSPSRQSSPESSFTKATSSPNWISFNMSQFL